METKQKVKVKVKKKQLFVYLALNDAKNCRHRTFYIFGFLVNKNKKRKKKQQT